MASWDDGYVTDVPYTHSFFREITPAWLAVTALLMGQRAPNLAEPFHYADLGCGNGFTAAVIAAACPHAEVWGFDFNPAHIEFATALAARSGLGNLHFVETSFADLAALPDAVLPGFDFMVAHGVLSWISPENRRCLLATIAKRLKPGGLVYLGYNVTTGWASMLPLRTLMRALVAASPERTDAAVPGMLDYIERLMRAGALFFRVHPSLEMRLEAMRKHDSRYIAHEYLNQDWHPLMFAEVAAEMAEAKCRFIGSATLTENIPAAAVPANVVPFVTEARDPFLRETLRDLGCAQTFRRDLFRKGATFLPAAEHQGLLGAVALAGLGKARPEGEPTFATAIGSVSGDAELYRSLLAMLEAGPLSFEQMRQVPEFADKQLVELAHAFALLIHGGYAHPMLPEACGDGMNEPARRLNRAIAEANAKGTSLPQLAAPAIGSAIDAELTEILVVGEWLAGRPTDPDRLTCDLVAKLAQAGTNVLHEGKPLTDPAQASGIVRPRVMEILEQRVPLFRRLGILH